MIPTMWLKHCGQYYHERNCDEILSVYREDTEEIIAFGNAVQCAEILGLKDARQFHAFVSKTRSGLRKRYKVVIEEDDEE